MSGENNKRVTPIGFISKSFDTYIDLDNDGNICFQTGYPCEDVALTPEESRHFLQAMINLYKSKGDAFWED